MPSKGTRSITIDSEQLDELVRALHALAVELNQALKDASPPPTLHIIAAKDGDDG